MLDKMRESKNSFIINFVIGLIVLVFIFWTGSPGSGQRIEMVAKVNNKQISEAEFARAVANQIEQMRRFSRTPVPKSEEAAIRTRVLDQLIETELLRQEALRLGIVVSDYELQQEILNNPNLKDESGKFDGERYKRILERYPSFEMDERERLQLTRLEGLMRNMVQVSEADLQAAYAAQNTKVNLEYVKLNYSAFDKDIQITPEERAAYIKDHAEDIQARYDQDFEKLYNKPKRVQARHILLKFEPTDSQEVKDQVLAKMQEIKLLTNDRDFAELAMEYSEDPGSTSRGGDLGFFDEKRMDPAFSQVAFSTAKGAISDVVTTRFGVHLIKVEDIQEAEIKAIEQVRDEIADTLIKAQKAPELARQAADKIKAVWAAGGPELQTLLTQYNLSAQETGLNARTGDTLRQIGPSADLADAAYVLTSEKATPDSYFTVGDSFVFIRLKERQEADMAGFESQKEQLKSQALREKQTKIFNAWKADLKARAKIEFGVATAGAES